MDKQNLTPSQFEIMQEFYHHDKTKVILKKGERNKLWDQAKARKQTVDFSFLNTLCPSLVHQIIKSYASGKNIQAAVFSECVYAQTLANMFHLENFYNCLENKENIEEKISPFLKEHNLYPRYIYSNKENTKILVQAGGHQGIDCAFIDLSTSKIFTIEFKEPGAKTSEPDLPKYEEDGFLKITDKFKNAYPQFMDMLSEHATLNFFEVMGNNIHDFSLESIHRAITNNYSKKYADVICTEDTSGYFVMIPVNQVSLWVQTEGEIRPAGRNHYNVWTPIALNRFLKQLNASFHGEMVTVLKSNLELRKARGGNGKVTGYKITPLFFVYLKDCDDDGTFVTFNIKKIQQLNPTIAGKMFFKNLKYNNVKDYYGL